MTAAMLGDIRVIGQSGLGKQPGFELIVKPIYYALFWCGCG